MSNRRTIRSDGAFTTRVPEQSHDDTIVHTVRHWGTTLRFQPEDQMFHITILDVTYLANARTGACLPITHQEP